MEMRAVVKTAPHDGSKGTTVIDRERPVPDAVRFSFGSPPRQSVEPTNTSGTGMRRSSTRCSSPEHTATSSAGSWKKSGKTRDAQTSRLATTSPRRCTSFAATAGNAEPGRVTSARRRRSWGCTRWCVCGIRQGPRDERHQAQSRIRAVKVGAFLDALGNAVHSTQVVDLAGKSVLITGFGPIGAIVRRDCRALRRELCDRH